MHLSSNIQSTVIVCDPHLRLFGWRDAFVWISLREICKTFMFPLGFGKNAIDSDRLSCLHRYDLLICRRSSAKELTKTQRKEQIQCTDFHGVSTTLSSLGTDNERAKSFSLLFPDVDVAIHSYKRDRVTTAVQDVVTANFSFVLVFIQRYSLEVGANTVLVH